MHALTLTSQNHYHLVYDGRKWSSGAGICHHCQIEKFVYTAKARRDTTIACSCLRRRRRWRCSLAWCTINNTSPTASGKGLRRLAQCVWMAGCDCGVVVFFWIQLWCGTRFGENSYCRFILWPYKIIANRSWMMMHRTEMGISLLLLLPDDYLPPLLQPPASHLLRTIFNQWEINVIFHNIILWLKVYHHYSC